MLRLGWGSASITPAQALPMAGMPGAPRGNGVVWPLEGTVMLLDDGAQRAALVCCDLMALTASAVADLRGRLAPLGGLEPHAIMVACSHTHRAPMTYLVDAPDEAEVSAYLEFLNDAMAEAMEAAAQLAPAMLTAAKTAAPGWAFNRRPLPSNGDVGTHGPATVDTFVRMEASPDEELQLLVARGHDGNVLGGVANVACHPTAMVYQGVDSADYPGVLRAELQRRFGGVWCFLRGARVRCQPTAMVQ